MGGGWLADHIGRRKTIVLGTFGAALSVMALYEAQSLPAIVAATILVGLFNGTYHPAAAALLADIIPEAQRVRAYAAVRLAANAGFAFGTATGGVLVNYSPFWLFAGDALTTALYGVIALLWLPHGLRGQTHHAPWRAALASFTGHRAFHSLWIATACAAIVTVQTASTYSLHVTRTGATAEILGWHLAPENLYGLLIAWNGVLIVLLELPLTSWTLRFDPRRVMGLGFLLQGLGFALNGVASGIVMLGLMMTVFTIGEMISAPTASAFVARLAPPALRGRYMGALGLAWNTAGIAGPLVGFRLFAYDPRALWIACLLLGVCSAWCILRARLDAGK
jgi:MFS family permease